MNPERAPSGQQSASMVQFLYTLNRLTQKAYNAKNKNSLIFTILNDTIQLVHYDRATLWDIEGKKPRLLGVSGQSKVEKKSALARQWEEQLKQLDDLAKPRTISLKTPQEEHVTEAVWLPIIHEDKPLLGLWLETWHQEKKGPDPREWMRVLMDLLMPVYAQAWVRLSQMSPFRSLFGQKKHWLALAIATLIITLILPVPLRVVAPCEVVPEDPFIIAAPLEGIVEKIIVQPGERVEKGDILFEYDKVVPLQQLEVAKKSVEVLESELDRAATLGLNDQEIRAQYAIILRRLQKEQLNLDLAKYQAERLTVTSPVPGMAQVERPDLWRGKPVQIGEQVLQVNNPKKSRVRIWIPESDNIQFTKDKSIKIFLNIQPTESIPAKLEWISSESSISRDRVISFVAEATWAEKPPEDVKLGLKGSAFLYGEDVSLFYFLIRKPWRFIRNFVGI